MVHLQHSSRTAVLCLLVWLGCFRLLWADTVPDKTDKSNQMVDFETEIVSVISECIDKGGPVDFEALVTSIQSLPIDIYLKDSTRFIESLGRMLLHEKKVQFTKPPITGRDPMWILRMHIIYALSRLSDRRGLIYLEEFSVSHSDNEYPGLYSAIQKLGGTVVEISRTSQRDSVVRDSINRMLLIARRSEVDQLVAAIKKEDLTDLQLNEIIVRIGKIGEDRDALPIIELLQGQGGDIDWIVRRNAIKTLGKLCGPETRDFLTRELNKKMPSHANLDDYGDAEAIQRSHIALAIGNCGDERTIELLTKMSNDKGQFKRVREACARAINKIKSRMSQTRE